MGLPPYSEFDDFFVSIIKFLTIFWHQQIVIVIFVLFIFRFLCTPSSVYFPYAFLPCSDTKSAGKIVFQFPVLAAGFRCLNSCTLIQCYWYQQRFDEEQKNAR